MTQISDALAAIDQINSGDPNTVDAGGTLRPKELVHAEAMTAWINRLDPNADGAQHIAARAHHLRRWALPRTDYPANRGGYLDWRSNARRQHAAEVDSILESLGFDEAIRTDIRDIISKTHLGSDPRVQTHEDALCLVFFELQGAGTAAALGDKTSRVVAKTLAKMSARGREALSTANIDVGVQSVIDASLSDDSPLDG